jgi:cyclic beta-1,2-glucan synthetase
MQIAPQITPPAESANSDADNRLQDFTRWLAQTHTLSKTRKHKPNLLNRLENWELALRNAYAIFKSVPAKDAPSSRAREWMLDNYYIIKQTLRQIEEDLPDNFLNQLPMLDSGLPRIFALAREWVGYSQSQLAIPQSESFVRDYQQVAPLTIGELWALPIMLRIGILERLVYATAELTGMSMPKGLVEIPTQANVDWPSETIVANCFGSLRLLAATDWQDFFEHTSRVEQILRNDPARVYANMDFKTRNSYRDVVEELARHSTLNEEQVALTAVELARDVPDDRATGRQGHIGFYLQDTVGRAQLEAKIRYKPEFSLLFRRILLATPTSTYLGSIATLSMLLVLGLLAYAHLAGGSLAQMIVVGLLGFGLALESAITIVHWQVTHRIKPQSLPRMDFSEGIPPGNRAMVVVPTLLDNDAELNHLLQDLELYYLSNPDPQLTYALLTDFGDAPTEHTPGDEQLLALAVAGIENLNKKQNSLGPSTGYRNTPPFYLFHRNRQWNPSEEVWMGWERKRGKLADFNRLLLNRGETAYTTQVGDVSILASIKYVITLDADTSLPQGSANRLIATLAHPLNQAEFSADGRSVVAGYTVLQPRVAIKPTSANRSRFSQIFAGNAGFDLYSFAVSDVYQDLFGEGSYVGKGIYDVAAFERSLAGQVRQNTLLSHDLFEGIYGRAALVTDVMLYEEYPSRYLAYARRLRRWVRGDWQLLPWMFPVVRTQTGLSPNRLSTIDLWKVFDNLRRSLLPPTLLALLAAGWLFLPGSPLIWTLLVLLPAALPIAVQTVQDGQHNLGRLTLKQILKPAQLPLTRWALAVLFLPYEALLMLDAISTTLGRLLIAHKRFLQWTTAAHTSRAESTNPQAELWREMTVSLVFTVLLGLSVAIFKPTAFWVAAPLLAAWLIAPQVAIIISRPVTHTRTSLTEPQRRQVLRLARRTWAFFEKFAGPDDHWLSPDHFQESPRGNVAHYTTPTNIGLFLVSTLSAYDLGYMGLSELALRLRLTFESMDKLEHYRGHLLNWYDSQSMTALAPRYVSTVDSGNLAASLITLKQGCLAMPDAPLLEARQWQGLLVLLDILSEALQSLEKNNPEADTESFEVELTSIYERVSAAQNQPEVWTMTLAWLSGQGWERVSRRLMELLESHPNLQRESLTELQRYLDLIHHQPQDMQRSLNLFAPWLGCQELPFLQTPAGQDFCASLPVEMPKLGEAASVYEHIQNALAHFKSQVQDDAAVEWCQKIDADLSTARAAVTGLLVDFLELAGQADAAINAMDFRFLFSQRRQVFHIGYNVSTEQLDPSYYDLLASEARIASLIAIAKGDVPQGHWQHLGRPVTEASGKQVLLSWSGTMFEYLMPTLFIKNYAGTFLSESCYAALDAQVDYGKEQKVPWGISESGYYAFDLNMNYQYRAFGVPSLGYKRDLPEDLVVTPYASLLGLSMQPQAVLKNMARLEELNMLGRFGFYEAIDYTKTRLPEKHYDDVPAGRAHAIVQSYMAHHQGMILMAVCNYILDDVMVARFHANEHIQSVELLLQEKVPLNPPLEFPHTDEPTDLPEDARAVTSAPWRVPVNSPSPQVHILAQGDASLLITNAGGGYSQWREFALTRWQADTTLDHWGTWVYIQDRESGALWSATCQPLGFGAEQQEVLFYPHKVEFPRSDNGITLRTGITISSEGVEVRRVNIFNDSGRPRQLKLTSYGEVVLAAQIADRRHPAFNKLFIESEYLPDENALIFERRPRSADEKPVVLIHAMVIEAGRKISGEYESDRAKFLGRLNTTRNPLALKNANQPLSGSAGGTLDPIFSLAQEIDLKPRAKTRVSFSDPGSPHPRRSTGKTVTLPDRAGHPSRLQRRPRQQRTRTARTGAECLCARKYPTSFVCPALSGGRIAARAAPSGRERKGPAWAVGLWDFW